jgi:hypothetical protein
MNNTVLYEKSNVKRDVASSTSGGFRGDPSDLFARVEIAANFWFGSRNFHNGTVTN